MSKKEIKKNKIDDFLLYTKIFDELPKLVDIVDENCRIVYLNKLLLKRVGKSAIGKKCFQVYKADKKQCAHCPLKKPIKVGEIKSMDVPGIVGNKTFFITHKGIKIGGKKYILEVFEDVTEKNKAEKIHRELIDRFNEVQKVTRIGSWEWNISRNEVIWSDEAYRLFGLKPQSKSLTYENYLDFIHPDDKKRVMSLVSNTVKTGAPFDYETRVIIKNKEFIYNGKGAAVKDKTGKVIKLLGTIQDITERIKQQRLLVEEKLKSEKYLKIAGSAILALDNTGKVILANKKIHEILGYADDYLLGKNWFNTVIPKNLRKEIKKVFTKLIRGEIKNVENYDNEIVAKDGKIKMVSWFNTLLRDSQGKIVGTLSSGIDITERKIVEEKNKRLSDIIEKTFEPIAVIDLGNTNILQYVNPAWEKMFGYRAKEVIGKKVGLLLEAVKLDPKLSLKLRHSIKIGKIFSAEMKWKRKNGELIDVEVFSSPMRDGKGKIVNWFNTVRDITERKKIEMALSRSEKRYRRLFETAKDSILILNAHNGKIMDANPFIQKSLGYSLKELIGKEIWQISPFRNIVENKKKFTELRKKKYVHYENLPLETKKGELKHVEFVSNIYGVNGEQVVQCNIRDITDRYNVAQALLESEEKHRLLYETSPDAIMTLEPPSWKFTSGNFAIRKMFGVKNVKEFVAYEPWRLSPKYQPDGQLSRVKAKKMINKAMKEGSNYFEWTHKRANGEDFFATVLLNRVYFKGKFLLQARVQDISEIKVAQQALVESEEKYRTLVETSPDCVKLFDLDGRLLYMNKGGLKEHRLRSLQSALKKNWSAKDSIEEEYHEEFSRALENAKKGKSSILEIKHDPKFSIRNFCLESVVPIKNNKGKTIGIFAISHDISEIKQIQEKLQDSERKLNATLNSMGDGLFVVAKNNNNIVLFNRTASVISGFSAKVVLGSPYNKFIKFVSEKTGLPNDNFIKVCLNEGREMNFVNHTVLVKKNKEKISVFTNASPLKDVNDNVVGAVVLFRDVSREREIDKMKSEFVSLASHQLKTPLTGIKWFTELLLKEKSGGLNGEQKDYVKRVFDSNERMINLVNDLLDVSHIDAGSKFDIVRKPADVVQIVNEVVQDKINLINDRKITVIKCPDALDKLEMLVDSDKLRQVFDNLINNAIKYSHVGGIVELGCKHDLKDGVVFYIKDSGIGIPKHQQKRVYDKFFRGDNALTAQTDGTGLGLYIARAVVEAHGGKMWFESKEGKGSTFYFSLPINN